MASGMYKYNKGLWSETGQSLDKINDEKNIDNKRENIYKRLAKTFYNSNSSIVQIKMFLVFV